MGKYMEASNFINVVMAKLTDLRAEDMQKVQFAIAAAV